MSEREWHESGETGWCSKDPEVERCLTCNDTGMVPSQDYDGSVYDQVCPDCERIPSSAGEPDATDTEAAMIPEGWPPGQRWPF